MLHGQRSSGEVHKFTQRIGQYSVGVPIGSDKLNYDLRFVLSPSGKQVDLEISQSALGGLSDCLRERVEALPEPRARPNRPRGGGDAPPPRSASRGHRGSSRHSQPQQQSQRSATRRGPP